MPTTPPLNRANEDCVTDNPANYLTEKDIRTVFDDIDADKNGTISFDELLMAGVKDKKLGPFFSEQMCREFFVAVDSNANQTIDFEEFSAWTKRRETEVLRLFNQLDADNRGNIDIHKFQSGLAKVVGVPVTSQAARRILDIIDDDKSGTIEYKELLRATLFLPGDLNEVVRGWATQSTRYFLYSDTAAPQREEEVPAMRTFIAGVIAGAICRTMTAPLDRISAVLRAGGTVHGESSIMGIGRSMVRVGGYTSLFRGNGMNCLKDGPESGLMFMAYDGLKQYTMYDPQKPTVLEKFLTGGAAGTFSLTLTYPGYVVQTRLAIAEASEFNGIMDCLKKTVRREGFTALYKGYDAAVLRVIPECGLNLMGYMTLRERFVKPNETPTVLQSLAFGSMSSLVSQTVAAPMLVARTRLMAQGSLGRPVVYNNAIDCLYKVVYGSKQLNLPAEGFKALFRGHAAYLLKMIPGTAIQFASFETICNFLKPYTG